MKTWETKRVRAYNLKPGDMIRCWNTKTQKEMSLTVHWVDDKGDEVFVGFRRRMWGWILKRHQLMRIRRRDRDPKE